jgi:hypothetical protein
MVETQLEFFLHCRGAKPKVVSAAVDETLRGALVRAGIIQEGESDVLVFVGESQEALAEPDELEDGADEHAPADASLTLEALGIGHRHRHVHCHTCRHIATGINFGGKTKRHKFSPATTVGVVTQWARRKFRLDPAAAAEYVLQLCGTTEQPRSDTHLGELAERGTCSLCFDLVKEITPQG